MFSIQDVKKTLIKTLLDRGVKIITGLVSTSPAPSHVPTHNQPVSLETSPFLYMFWLLFYLSKL